MEDTPTKVFFNGPFFSGVNYEIEVVNHLVKRLDNCGCFVDIGANLGYYSVLAGKILATKGGKVHAIEMDADIVNIIQKNLSLNELSNVYIHEIALGNREGSISFGHSINDVWNVFEKHHYWVWEIPLRKGSKQSAVRLVNDVRDIAESTMLYASNIQ
jgi:FkbM family methyltransferase